MEQGEEEETPAQLDASFGLDRSIFDSGTIGHIWGVELYMTRWHYFQPRRRTKRALRRYRHKRILVRMTPEEIEAALNESKACLDKRGDEYP